MRKAKNCTQFPVWRILSSLRGMSAFALFAVTACSGLATDRDNRVFAEDFDDRDASAFQEALLVDPNVDLVRGLGFAGSNAIRVTYVGSRVGSERVVMRHPLEAPLEAATLHFKVKFEEDFQWVLGGKLHGVGPAYPVTGGQRRKSNGWSSRIMFSQEGTALSYIYDQNQALKWGAQHYSCAPVFKKDQWHSVALTTVLNEPGKSNGWTSVKVDGELKIVARNVDFRRVGGEDTLIQKFLFSTFHGGGSGDWAPKTPSGEYATVHALFDDIEVTRFDASWPPMLAPRCAPS